MQRKTSVRITPASAGGRVLDFVSGRFTYRSRDEWQQELNTGRFLVNDIPATPLTLLAAGDRLVYLLPELVEPPAELRFTVLYEDADLLVVDKPAGLPCHPAGRYFRHTLWALLQERHGLTGLSLINRLDRETSGLVLVAKHKKAARHCYQQFARRLVRKRYLVLVEGEFPAEALEAVGWLAVDPAGSIRKKVCFYPEAAETAPAGAVECRTSFQRLHIHHGLSLLEAMPITGRCHQIRATLCSLGYPLVGDKLYGVDDQLFLRFREGLLTAADWQRLRIKRQALHAATLHIRHPADNRELVFSSPLPPAIKELLGGSGEEWSGI